MLDSKNPVVFFANAIGDHLLTLPALRALVKLFSEKLTLIGAPYFQQVFLPEFCSNLIYKPEINWDGKRWAFDVEAVANNLEACDLLLWLSTWHPLDPGSILKRLSPLHSVGFCPGFEIDVPVDCSKHAADLVFDVPLHLSPTLRIEDFAYPPIFGRANQQRAREIRRLVPESMKVMVVHPDTKPEKMWTGDRWRVLLDLFLERHPEFVVFLVGHHKPTLNPEHYGKRIFVYSNRLALATALAMVGEADLFLGVDSCMLHAADLFRVPGVGLFGPTACEHWGFRFTPHQHVCNQKGTDRIQIEEVLVALEGLLEDTIQINKPHHLTLLGCA